mmetsp:Transcript_29520/g.43606  ORF Transcript_29520/g.43606 Transcript_29520/m.43606 type:complete len:315 (+) Transcript_29520:64-1008(+)
MMLTKGNSSRFSFLHRRLPFSVNQQRLLSNDSTSTSSSNNTTGEDRTMAVVLRGPSTLYTSLHRPSPSLMMMPGLRSLPVWTSYDAKSKTNRIAYQDPSVNKIVQHLQAHVEEIRDEYLSASPSLDSDYDETSRGEHSESSLHTGKWDWHSYLLQGRVQPDFCLHFPNTTRILGELQQDIFMGTPFGFCFFSKLTAQSTIQAHTSPINFRLRLHLPLVVPSDGDIGIRVGPTQHKWTANQALVLDDSYEHEVWNNTNEDRILLLVDIWHPDVRMQEREEIINMFQHAKEKGWLDGDKEQKKTKDGALRSEHFLI